MNNQKVIHSGPKFFGFFIILAAACVLAFFLSTAGSLPSADSLFGDAKIREQFEGVVEVYTPPRGTPRLNLQKNGGGQVFMDCAAVAELCNNINRKIRIEVSAVRLSGNAYWPISILAGQKQILSAEESRDRYSMYIVDEISIHKIWLYLSGLFIVMAIIFKNRPILGGKK